MNCDRCGEYIEEFAICPNCVTELEMQIKRTPVELAAEDLFQLLKDIKDEDYLLDGCGVPDCASCKRKREIENRANELFKVLSNLSPQVNPVEQDEHKSAP